MAKHKKEKRSDDGLMDLIGPIGLILLLVIVVLAFTFVRE